MPSVTVGINLLYFLDVFFWLKVKMLVFSMICTLAGGYLGVMIL